MPSIEFNLEDLKPLYTGEGCIKADNIDYGQPLDRDMEVAPLLSLISETNPDKQVSVVSDIWSYNYTLKEGSEANSIPGDLISALSEDKPTVYALVYINNGSLGHFQLISLEKQAESFELTIYNKETSHCPKEILKQKLLAEFSTQASGCTFSEKVESNNEFESQNSASCSIAALSNLIAVLWPDFKGQWRQTNENQEKINRARLLYLHHLIMNKTLDSGLDNSRFQIIKAALAACGANLIVHFSEVQLDVEAGSDSGDSAESGSEDGYDASIDSDDADSDSAPESDSGDAIASSSDDADPDDADSDAALAGDQGDKPAKVSGDAPDLTTTASTIEGKIEELIEACENNMPQQEAAKAIQQQVKAILADNSNKTNAERKDELLNVVKSKKHLFDSNAKLKNLCANIILAILCPPVILVQVGLGLYRLNTEQTFNPKIRFFKPAPEKAITKYQDVVEEAQGYTSSKTV